MNQLPEQIQAIQSAIEATRESIVKHPVYGAIQDVQDLYPFIQHHVFAVWDFMSLLKALQNELTCTRIPWVPIGNPQTRFLINEIVVGEESDELPAGGHISHFELYLQAMQQAGASTETIQQFIAYLQAGESVSQALQLAKAPEGARQFVEFTFEIINSGKPHVMAAVFTFGREDLIPDMFHSLVNDLNERFPEQIELFKYYLDRHIEVDGDHHSHLAIEMTSQLCGEDAHKWAEAKVAVINALEMRKMLWDSALKILNKELV